MTGAFGGEHEGGGGTAEMPQVAQDLTGSTVGRYVVRSRIGGGGMGEVYLADDPVLKRAVALKRLAPFLGGDPRYFERLLREGQRASALNHPHIAAVYDVVESGNELFLVMEYVKGTTLRERLKQSVSVPEFLPLAVQCAEALEAAHARGILHGDLKPENIMLTASGDVKVLDFGVARRLPNFDSAAATRSVQGGLTSSISGTPAYMAPEVLLGGEADGRADLFSLGAVFYEMLAGRHPFLAERRTLDRLLHEDPELLCRVNPAVPAALEQIVGKMLAKKPEDRYASAREVVADLRAVETGGQLQFTSRRRKLTRRGKQAVVAAGVLIAAALAGTVPAVRWRLRDRISGPIPERRDLAVLPFAVVGADPEIQAFSDGLAETLTAKLTQLTERQPLAVVPAREIRQAGVTDDARARREFGVNLVLEGSLHRSGNTVRVTQELVDARTHRQLRAEVVTASFTDPFGLEDKIAADVMNMLELELGPGDERALESHGTAEPGAYEAYVRGRGYLLDYQKPESLAAALTVFRQALARDSRYALAYAGLGETYWRKYELDKDPQWIGPARQACRQAVELEERASEGHICLGQLEEGTGAYEAAAREYQRAIDLDPTNDDAYGGLASAYEALSKPELAESTYRKAIALRPDYWGPYNWLGAFYFSHARYPDAERMFKKVVDLAPDNYNGYNNLGGIYLMEGRWADAIPMLERSASIRPNPASSSNLGSAYFNLRRFQEAVRAYQDAIRLDPRNYELWGNLADAEAWVPDLSEQARDAYRKALALAGGALQVNPRDAKVLSYAAWYHATLGERAQALDSVKRALQLAPHDPELLYNAALVYNQLGDPGRALAWAREAVAAGFPTSAIASAPYFDGLRDRPEFQQLIRKS
jgi:eukaryotic-like serine/threonine-protein kinase